MINIINKLPNLFTEKFLKSKKNSAQGKEGTENNASRGQSKMIQSHREEGLGIEKQNGKLKQGTSNKRPLLDPQ